MMRNALLFLFVVSLAGCATSPPRVTMLAFGDSGYHYDHLELEDREGMVTQEQFVANERAEWIEDKRPIGEFAYPPSYALPPTGTRIAASGLVPVSFAMKRYCAEKGCDFATLLGDNVYPDGADGTAADEKRFRDVFTTPFAPLAQRPDFRIYTVLGNHDWHTSREGAMAQVRFLEATPPFYMQGLFYRVQPPGAHGEVEIFAIDTQMLLAAMRMPEAALADDGSEAASEKTEEFEPWSAPQTDAERNMVAWLESALASSTARWKVVIGHHPLWSTAGSKFQQARALRRLILPTLCRHADLYLAGHEHTLEVHEDDCSTAVSGEKLAPLTNLVSGSASKMRPTNSAFIRHQNRNNPQLQTHFAKGLVWGFAHLTFEGDRLDVKMVEVPMEGGSEFVGYERTFVRRQSPN